MQQLSLDDYLRVARFEGAEARDCDRLCGQMKDVYNLMSDGQFRTLEEIRQATGHPEASISAQIRHLRKHRFGAHTIEKRRRRDGNQYEYRLLK